jgi:two-component system, chemotaxis family, CheB/CheR fusion protein
LAPSKSTRLKTVASNPPQVKPFPIVGFGASAGGIEAFVTVLSHLDPNLGMAYVFVMHLSPTHKSALTEILHTKTTMKVHTVKDGMEVHPNNVYVIPPNTFMSLIDGYLKLAPRSLSTIGNYAVDYFLIALASVYKNNAIGVILSGTATDGTIGLKAIKAEGGITFTQDGTAKFSGMPKSAYDSGYADFVLSPEEIARELKQLVKIPYTVLPADKIEKKHEQEIDSDAEVIKSILQIVLNKTGIDFYTNYKQASIYRRIARRVVLNKCATLKEYHSILEGNEKEVNDLYQDFLINVTYFFRDPDFYKTLSQEIFPTIIKSHKLTDPIRIWVAGCATGEEVYSVAICLMGFLEAKNLNTTFQIFASDLDANAIEKARAGIYPLSALQSLTQDHLIRYFKRTDGHYQIDKKVREVCVFSQHNLLRDPPFSRMDLISCQNVLIYLKTNPQQKILQIFHYALKSSGYLFLGRSENIGDASDLYNSMDKKIRVYTRKSTTLPPLEFATQKIGFAAPKEIQRIEQRVPLDIEKDMSKILLTHFVPPSIVLNQNLNIIQFFGNTTSYLQPVVGKASLNVLKMIREDLILDLRTLLQQAKKTEKTCSKAGIKIVTNKIRQDIAIEVVPKKTEAELFFLVVFKESQPVAHELIEKGKRSSGQKQQTIIKLEEELIQSRELIRTTNEEYETTYEELQANNEEILSSNEELQSVNEELETSKEELQSANEELTTINEELQKRNVQLKETENYAEAIITTVNSPFLILTANFQVRLANRSFYHTFKLSPETSEGSFIYELGNHGWEIPALRASLNELLSKKSNYLEFELKHFFPGLGNMIFIVKAYALLKDDINKETLILLAFNDQSELLKSNQELKKANEHLEQFAFVSSHDLQEPLRKIEIFSNYLLAREGIDSFTENYANKINATSVRMKTLLKDLLNYSVLLRNSEKKLSLVDLTETLKNVSKDLELFIEEKNAVLNFTSLPTIVAEPFQMNQLFYNLISNALKFSRDKPVISITAENLLPDYYEKFNLTKGRKYVSIRVSDNGIGFDIYCFSAT